MEKTNQWQQDTDKVLGLFGTRKGTVRTKYRKFVEAGALDGRKPELTGGGLIRSSSGWGVLKTMWKMKQHLKGDEKLKEIIAILLCLRYLIWLWPMYCERQKF
jgi:hypothetical protein